MCENCLGNVEKSVTENMAKGVPQTGVFSVYQYSDVMMGAMTSLYIYICAQIKENIRVPRHWPLCGEFTGDRWIPRINGQ